MKIYELVGKDHFKRQKKEDLQEAIDMMIQKGCLIRENGKLVANPLLVKSKTLETMDMEEYSSFFQICTDYYTLFGDDIKEEDRVKISSRGESGNTEHFWVIVKKIYDDGTYIGEVSNDLVGGHEFNFCDSETGQPPIKNGFMKFLLPCLTNSFSPSSGRLFPYRYKLGYLFNGEFVF